MRREDRYELVQEIGDTWAIFDTVAEVPVVFRRRLLAGLSLGDATAYLRRLLLATDPPTPET